MDLTHFDAPLPTQFWYELSTLLVTIMIWTSLSVWVPYFIRRGYQHAYPSSSPLPSSTSSLYLLYFYIAMGNNIYILFRALAIGYKKKKKPLVVLTL